MHKKQNKILIIFLFILIILLVGYAIVNREIEKLLWFCFANLFLLFIGLLYKKNLLISSVLTSVFLVELIWTIDALSFLFTGSLSLGANQYLLGLSSPILFALTSYHFVLLIVPIYLIFKEKKFQKLSWILSSAIFLLVSFLSFIFANSNINCSKTFCAIGLFNFIYSIKPNFLPFFIFHWLFATLVVFIPTNYLFSYLVNRKKRQINPARRKIV